MAERIRFRMAELLDSAAKALEDYRDPFESSWLIENDVTFDECMELSGWMATGAEMMAALMRNPRAAEAAVAGAMLTILSDRIKSLELPLSKESS